MSVLITFGTLVAAAAIAVGIQVLHKASRLELFLEEHDRAEADLEAMTIPEDRPCGCRWLPCDKHRDRLMRVMRKEGEQ